MKIRSRVQLRKNAKNKLMDELTSTFGDSIKELKNSKFETALIDIFNVILIDGKLLLFSTDGEYFPTVRGALELGLAKHIVIVDAGAVRFVVNGADIMCPAPSRQNSFYRTKMATTYHCQTCCSRMR